MVGRKETGKEGCRWVDREGEDREATPEAAVVPSLEASTSRKVSPGCTVSQSVSETHPSARDAEGGDREAKREDGGGSEESGGGGGRPGPSFLHPVVVAVDVVAVVAVVAVVVVAAFFSLLFLVGVTSSRVPAFLWFPPYVSAYDPTSVFPFPFPK